MFTHCHHIYVESRHQLPWTLVNQVVLHMIPGEGTWQAVGQVQVMVTLCYTLRDSSTRTLIAMDCVVDYPPHFVELLDKTWL